MGNIVAFPSTYPDEDFRSIVHRYYLRSPLTFTMSNIELFGEKGARKKANIIPLNLSRITDEFGLTIEFAQRIIENHTYLPFFRSFLTVDKQIKLWEVMYSKNYELSDRFMLQRLTQSLLHNTSHYCPICIYDDFSKYGIVYLHRTHQFSFLKMCHIHGSGLIDVCPICNTSLTDEKGSQMLIEPKCPNGHEILIDNNNGVQDSLENKQLLSDFNTLFQLKSINLEIIYIKLISYLGVKGYIHFRGEHIYKKKLLTDVIKFYDNSYLSTIGLDSIHLLGSRSIMCFLQKDNLKERIILYLLVIRFLAGNLEDFIYIDQNYSLPVPFGNGPWLCINAICPKYNQRAIPNVKRTAHAWITGRFICPYCGMIYTRGGLPHPEDEKQYTIETMGALFMNRAIQLFEEGLIMDKIAAQLLTNRRTLRKYLKPYRNLKRDRSYQDKLEQAAILKMGYHETAASTSLKIEEYRNTVKDAIEVSGPAASRLQIRKYSTRRYDWLMKNDREWIDGILPPKQGNQKFNLDTVDEEMFQIINKAIKQVKAYPSTNQFTKECFLRAIPKTLKIRYYHFRKYLHRTTELMESNVETIDECAIRIFPYILEKFMGSSYRRLTKKRLQHLSHVYKKCSPKALEWAENEALKYYK